MTHMAGVAPSEFWSDLRGAVGDQFPPRYAATGNHR
jgi:hypothetical protein